MQRRPFPYPPAEVRASCPHLGDVVDQVLVAVLRVHLAQLGQPLQVALDLVFLALQRQAVVHHRFDLLHLLGRLGVSDGSPLHRTLVLCFLLPRETRLSELESSQLNSPPLHRVQLVFHSFNFCSFYAKIEIPRVKLS